MAQLLTGENLWLLAIVLGLICPPLFMPRAMRRAVREGLVNHERVEEERLKLVRDEVRTLGIELRHDLVETRKISVLAANAGTRAEDAVAKLTRRVEALEPKDPMK